MAIPGAGDTSWVVLDALLIVAGWALVITASAVHVRRFPGVRFGPFAPREQRLSASRRSWQVNSLFMAGIVVATAGGANAQRHFIGYWAALAIVFVPMFLGVALISTVHNRRVKTD